MTSSPQSSNQIVIGIDFGTAFTKVMVRNDATDELFALKFRVNGGEVFFLPSEMYAVSGTLQHPLDFGQSGCEGTFPFLKMALAAKHRSRFQEWIALMERSSAQAAPKWDLGDHVHALVGLYLKRVLEHAAAFVREKWPNHGKHPDDRTYYHMAIPAQDVEEEAVLGSFRSCLCWAARIIEEGKAHDPDLTQIEQQIRKEPARDTCHFLAEVTANVMTYRHSRTGRPGFYLFADVGAGTVDLSAFLYPDPKHHEPKQTYLGARVSPTGSSHIELAAFTLLPNLVSLLRQRKETSSANESLHLDEYLSRARETLEDTLDRAIREVLGDAMARLRREQFMSLKILTGGGGWCESPYANVVTRVVRDFGPEPDLFPLPAPENALEIWGEDATRLAPRFSVAHGLSYPSWRWPEERYPGQVSKLDPRPPPPRYQPPPAAEDDG